MKLTKRLASGIKLWKFYFQIRARCALTSAFDKIAGKKNCRQMLFLQEAHQNGWHAASSYRNAILNSELAFPIFNFIYVPAKKAFACNKYHLPAINSVCLQ
jgi:hypothetical protein